MRKRYLFALALGMLPWGAASAWAVPANDLIGDAIPLGGPGTVSGTTIDATFDGMPFCGTSNTAPGVWYSAVGTGDFFNFDTFSAATNYDTKISVYSGSTVMPDCVDGDDDDFSSPFNGLQSQVGFGSVLGENYYVLVHGFGSATGVFDLNYNIFGPPVNDDVVNASPLDIGVPMAFDNRFATAESGEVSPGAGTGPSTCNSQDGWCSFETDADNSLWYTFMAPTHGSIQIDAGPSDTQLAVWDVSDPTMFGTFVEVAGNDDSGPGLSAAILNLTGLTAGNTYYVQLDGFSGSSTSDGTILITSVNVVPEPVTATLGLMGLGVLGLTTRRRVA